MHSLQVSTVIRCCTFLFHLAACFPLDTLAQNQPISTNITCSQARNRLDPVTHKFLSDCPSTLYCSSSNECLPKGCRKDEYPFGYAQGSTWPPICGSGMYCPDEEDQCQFQQNVGQPCQLNRDDECAPPPFDSAQLSSSHNFDESMCLDFACQYANVTLGAPCLLENTIYKSFSKSGEEYTNTISRDNCQSMFGYCDAATLLCLPIREVGESCSSDNECSSYNCNPNNSLCDVAVDAPLKITLWQYVLTGMGIAIMIIATWIILFYIHFRHRLRRKQEIKEYFIEQTTYRHSIITLHSVAQSRMSNDTSSSSRSASRLLPPKYQTQTGSEEYLLRARVASEGRRRSADLNSIARLRLDGEM